MRFFSDTLSAEWGAQGISSSMDAFAQVQVLMQMHGIGTNYDVTIGIGATLLKTVARLFFAINIFYIY